MRMRSFMSKKMFQGTSPRKTDVSRKQSGNHPYLALVPGCHALDLLYVLDGTFKYQAALESQ